MKIELQCPLARLSHALPYLYDNKVGIVANIMEHPIDIDSPRFFRYSCNASNTEAFGEYRNFAIGGGAATTREMALAKTVGEAVERYCAAIYCKQDFPLMSYAQASVECIHPDEWALYSAKQHDYENFMFDPFLTSSRVRWVAATDLHRGSVVYVPAAMVYVPYFFYENGDETPLTQPISTGLSCHCSMEEASIGGICEVIERDCFSITWQAQLSRPRICHTTLSANNQELVRRFQAAGYQVHLVDIRNESGVPSVMAVARHDGNFLPMVVAASTALTADEAVRKALEELAHTERYAFQIKGEVAPLAPDPEFDNITGQVDHVNFWTNPAMTQYAAFLTSSNERCDCRDMENFDMGTPTASLAKLVARIEQTGYRVLVCDISSSDVRELGMVAVRALIPGYHPLFMGYHHRALGGKRLWTLPQQLGYRGIEPGSGDYPYPHPFP
ncbi:YcaO-like family protein [Massilia scottii]|uniref:YcaO-like family protein n=1 Tax=Massilia scottii TaxID=3057166 RepID=UPI0027965813|nr:YcaO-like family protein [Massilia sp. CCM 9029]MDQ1830785.1 YcaO-like family protein [Massilia sp. CCM 9029]